MREGEHAAGKLHFGFAFPDALERRRRRRVNHNSAAMPADLRASLSDANLRVAAGADELLDHFGETRFRRRLQARATQEPAQEVARSRGRQRGKTHVLETAGIGDTRGVDCRQLVCQQRGFRLMPRGANQRCGIAGEMRGEQRRNLVADEIPRVPAVGVALVVDPGDRSRRRVGGEGLAREVEQRTQQRWSTGPECRHRSQALRTGTAQQLQQHRLRLIVRVMRESDHVDVGGEEAVVTRRSRDRLQAAAALASQLQRVHRQRDAARGALHRAELGPAVGVGRQTVVNMDCR
jgi:hypothetical protein